MARTLSTMLALGTLAPDFQLPNSHPRYGGDNVSLSDFAEAQALLVVFICNHCPYVVHIRNEFVRFAKEYQRKGLAVITISANDSTTHPDDSPVKMHEAAVQCGFTFPYLYDESQEVAKAYQAACTPDFFLFDAARKLFYRGQFDGARPNSNVPVTGEDLRRATEAVLSGQPAPAEQIPSIGCNIKWKSGSEPVYAVNA